MALCGPKVSDFEVFQISHLQNMDAQTVFKKTEDQGLSSSD
jgi:hypothetical protein